MIPAGVGRGHDVAAHRAEAWLAEHRPATTRAGKQAREVVTQFGTLGSGNHFFEVCLDERDQAWVVLHSGSRGSGSAYRSVARVRQAGWGHVQGVAGVFGQLTR